MLIALIVGAALIAGCGGDDDEESAATPAATQAPADDDGSGGGGGGDAQVLRARRRLAQVRPGGRDAKAGKVTVDFANPSHGRTRSRSRATGSRRRPRR